MDSRAGCARMARLVALVVGLLLAWPAAASAVTVTVGRQDLSTLPTTNFGCTASMSTTCQQTVSPTALGSVDDRAVIPADGLITSWRFRGIGSPGMRLWILRPSGAQYRFISLSPLVAQGTGASIPLDPALPVGAGDHLGVETVAVSSGNFARVDAVSAPGAGYDLFSGLVLQGTTVSPTSTGQNVEPLFNAEVVLDPPVVSSVSPGSGPTAGGQVVTIDGDHLTGVSQVHFGDTPASSFSAVSNSRVTAVTPPSGAGAVDVKVTMLGGTSLASTADRYTFEGPNPPAAADFHGSPSSITVNRKRRYRFGFHAGPGLTGTAVFKSRKRVQASSSRRVTLARKSFTVPASGRVALRIKLSKRKFRILKLNHRIRARVTVTLKNAAGLTSKASKNVTLKPPRGG